MIGIMYKKINSAFSTRKMCNYYSGNVALKTLASSFEGGAPGKGRPACLSPTCFFRVAKLGGHKISNNDKLK